MAVIEAGLDYSQPISTVLRESTKKAHENVEHSVAAVAMVKGQLEKEDYIRFLIMLWYIYDTFERALERHATNSILEPTYNPHLLARAPALVADISFFLDVPESSWKSHPVHAELMASPPPGLTKYIGRIEELANSDDPSPLLAHSYVRYLGDLSGGQSIKHSLTKAYGLDPSSSRGLEFFDFRELKSNKPANQGEMKRIKDWFREGMNTGAGDNESAKAKIADEANYVFDLNKGLFDSILTEEKKAKLLSKTPASKEIAVAPEDEGGYPVASVATVIVAVGLAHFMLTVTGFTGSSGSAKLASFFGWIHSLID